MSTRSYTIIDVELAGSTKILFEKKIGQFSDAVRNQIIGGRFLSRTPSGAAKKAATRAINLMYPRKGKGKVDLPDVNTLKITIRETTQGSKKDVRTYVVKREILDEPKVVSVKYTSPDGVESTRDIVYRYTTTATLQPKESVEEKMEKVVQKAKADASVEVKKPKRKPRKKKVVEEVVPEPAVDEPVVDETVVGDDGEGNMVTFAGADGAVSVPLDVPVPAPAPAKKARKPRKKKA